MIICDKCVHKMYCIDYDTKTECKYFDQITNEEWLRQANTEQLAEWLKKHMNCNFCPMRLKCDDMRGCMEIIKVWLRQPHTAK